MMGWGREAGVGAKTYEDKEGSDGETGAPGVFKFTLILNPLGGSESEVKGAHASEVILIILFVL